MAPRKNSDAEVADIAQVQWNIKRNVIMMTSLSVLIAAVAYNVIPADRFQTLSTAPERLVFTVQWNVLPVCVLFVLFAHIGNVRIYSRQVNPLVEEDREKVEVHVRVLQNTVEQFVMSFSAQLATSTWLDASQMAVIPIVVVLFVAGRLLFWRGYLDPSLNRSNRSYGLPLSAYPTMALLVFCVYKLVAKNLF